MGPFRFNPAYPYLLALLGKLTGTGFAAVFVFQHVLGALAAALIFRVADELFDRRCAWVAGILAALYGPAFFFESRYLGELHIYLLNSAWLLALLGARRGGLGTWLAAGLCLGASAAFRPTALALLPLSLLWCAGLLYANRARLAAAAGLLLLGTWLPMLPFQIRNRLVDPASGWGLATASGGVNLYLGNNPEADGLNRPASFARGGPGHQYEDFQAEARRVLGRELSAREADRYWAGRARDWFVLRPREAWRLVRRKAGYFWNRREPPDNFFLTLFQNFSRLGPLPLPGWGLVAPLGLAGMLWSLASWRRTFPAHAYVLAYLALNAAFMVLSRYRFPAAAALIPFAAFAFTRLEALLRGRSWLKAAALGLLLAASFQLSRLRLIGEEDMAVTHYSMGVIYANQGWPDRAAEEYRLSIRADPNFEASYLNLGLLQAGRGQAREAAWALEAAARLEGDGAKAERMRNAARQVRAGISD
ncbi:MAG: glycosyltransferase family 39 protein [Elusimicrobia bacterium]|nr:glycosyltransferase family 39 protein [Elusimicrobiota bacterium]